MLNKVMIGRYYPIDSLVHKMNPLAKMICVLLFIIMSFLTFDIRFNVLLLVLLILMLNNTKVPFKIYLRTIFSIKWLLLFILIINLIVGSNLSVTIITLLRLIYVLLYTSILTLTTPPTEITYGLEKLFLPLKLIGIPVNKMALSISLALRFIPTIIDQGNKIIKSQASRGIDYYNSNLKGKILAIKSLIIPMFALSIKKADDLADSMEVRLYNVNSKRINFRQNKWHFYDTFLVLMHLGLFILIMKEVVLWGI